MISPSENSAAPPFEPKIIAYVCNWCTYLGADLAGTNRLEYPANVRIIRLPCTGRIDFNLIVKAFEIGADAVLVSGCHPGDCHYTAGNYHARRRWILFRQLLATLGIDSDRIAFTWISAAEGKKWQQVVSQITETVRRLGPYAAYRQICQEVSTMLDQLRETCRRLLEEKTVQVVIGYGQARPDGDPYPVFITSAGDVGQLVWNDRCRKNLVKYLARKEIRALGKPAIVVKGCDERALVVLEKESQLDRSQIVAIGMACAGMGEPRCETCDAHQPRFADPIIGQAANEPVPAQRRYSALAPLLEQSSAQRMAYWMAELARCVKCYACRQTCPLCYCERCIADKNRPTCIDTSATRKGNFAWQITRAFHLAGRCVGCDECTRACPAGIDLRLLNLSLAQAAEENFAFRAGTDPAAEPILGSYSQQDQELFIQ